MQQFGGSWSASKLDCVERYAQAYLKVMKNQQWCDLHYVDAFAGRGKQILKPTSAISAETLEIESFFGDESEREDTQEFLVGSSIRALKASRDSVKSFDRFILIDANLSSCAELRAHVESEFPEEIDNVSIECKDANIALAEYLSSVRWPKTRALVFLDPYGLEVGWKTIIRLATTKACDVWYLFPLGGVIRMMTNNGRIPQLWQARLDGLFGTHDWYDAFYRPKPQLPLFDNEQTQMQKYASTERVVTYIRQRLQTVFPAVSEAGVLRNRNGAPLFALLLGVANPNKAAQKAALNIANHLLKDLDR
jgi:three-Cys-motif partner protein